jgi:hypothetical protein
MPPSVCDKISSQVSRGTSVSLPQGTAEPVHLDPELFMSQPFERSVRQLAVVIGGELEVGGAVAMAQDR